jgi:hypothetical protein
MKPLSFFISLFAAFLFVSWFGHHTVRTTLPRQILSKYMPDTTQHVVFLGSSLTDAAVDQVLLDSLFKTRHMNMQAFNCALAEMAGDAYFYLIIKNWILSRGKPAAIAIELRMFPFSDSKKDFKLLGRGIAADLIIPELMDYGDYVHIRGGFPGVLESITFFLHKHWFLYHHRLNVQGAILERTPFAKAHTLDVGTNPYGMKTNAAYAMRAWVREGLKKQSICTDNGPLSNGGYFRDIVALAKEHNVQLIFFRPPFPPADGILRGNPVYEKSMVTFQKLCDSLGIINWDLAAPPAGTSWSFSDGIHCDRRSAILFTQEIADKIQESKLPTPPGIVGGAPSN